MFPIADILGIGAKLIDKLIPDPEAKAKAQLELAALAQSGELAKMNADLEAYRVEQDNLTDRLKADMASDSWMSKNVRPVTLMAILGFYCGFAGASAAGYDAKEAYVSLLGQWGMLIMSFYFGGRTLEKIMEMRKSK